MMMRRKQNDRQNRLALSASCLLAALALAGCASSPNSQYYTLTSPKPGVVRTAAPGAPANPLMIEMTPVNVPDQLARPQLVTTDDAGKVDIEDYRRWSGPLADEIGGALSTSLSRTLPAIDVYRTPRPNGATVYRITVNVRRFESIVGERATVDMVWSVVRSTDNLTMTCQSIVTEPVSSGYDALVGGHRKALAHVAADIGAAIQQERAEPVHIAADALPVSTSGSDDSKGKNGKKPASAGLGSEARSGTGTSSVMPTLLCPGTGAPAA